MFCARIVQVFRGAQGMGRRAKDETIAYYNENPGSYTVVTPTDLIMDYLNDIEELLNK